MNNKIKNLLDEIKNERNKNPYREFTYTPCTDKDIEKFNNWLKEEFGDSAPNLSGFIEFCQVADGFNSNGVFMFSINPDKDKYVNVYVKNEHWWEVTEEKRYLLIGDDDISWYALDLSSGKYCVLDLTSGDIMEEVDDVDELLEIALSEAL
jgi:hypothetical protein